MRKIAIAVVVAVALIAGGYFGISMYSDWQLRQALDRSIQTLPAGYTASYGSVHYSLLTRHGAVTNVAVRGPSALVVTIGNISVDRPNLDFPDGWSHAAANPDAVAPDLALPIAGDITVEDIAVHGGAIDLSIASARVEAPHAYPWALLHRGVPSIADLQAQLAGVKQPPQPADMAPLLQFEAAALLGVGYDAQVVEGMTASGAVAATADTPAMKIAYAVRRSEATGYDRGVIKNGSAEGVMADLGAEGGFKLDRVTVAAIDVRQPLTHALAGDPPSMEMADGLAIGRIEYDGMTVNRPDASPLTLTSFAISNVGFGHGLPISGAVTLAGLHMTRDQMPDDQSKQVFDQLGLQAATVSLSVGYNWDIDQKHLSVHDTSVKVDELGALDLSADAINVDPAGDWSNDGQLSHAVLHYVDASLVSRALKYGATQQGTDLAAFRLQTIQGVRQGARMFGTNQQIDKAVEQVVQFLRDPHKLTVELAPPEPASFSKLQAAAIATPADLATMLGLTVTAGPAP